MKKQTTRQRVEQAVESSLDIYYAHVGEVVIDLILAERRRIRHEVRNLSEKAHNKLHDYEQVGYTNACDDILARLRG